jgi:chromosomal replication initiator protein
MKEDMTTPLLIIQVVFDYFKVPLFYQAARIRKREIVLARQVSMYYMKESTTLSLSGIAGYFGQEHANVIHGIKAVNNLRDTDKRFRVDLIDIYKRIFPEPDLELKHKHYNTDLV